MSGWSPFSSRKRSLDTAHPSQSAQIAPAAISSRVSSASGRRTRTSAATPPASQKTSWLASLFWQISQLAKQHLATSSCLLASACSSSTRSSPSSFGSGVHFSSNWMSRCRPLASMMACWYWACPSAMLPRVCAAFCNTKTFCSLARRSTKGWTTPRSKAWCTFSSSSVSRGKAPTALKTISGDSVERSATMDFRPPSWRTVCCTVSSCARFHTTPAAFSTTVGCSESISLMRRLTAPACAMAKRFSWVSASESRVPRQFSMAGTNVENSKTLSRNGMPPAFRMVALTASTADRFQRALAAFSCKTSSVGLPMHWISAWTPPASEMAIAHSSCEPRFVSVMQVTARSVNGKWAFRSGTSFAMPSISRTASLQASSTARLRIVPAAASRASSPIPTSRRLSRSRTPSSLEIWSRYALSAAKFPRHSAALPTTIVSTCLSMPTRAERPSLFAISALLSSSTDIFFSAPAAARIQTSLPEPSIFTSASMPPSSRMFSRFSRSRARFSRQFAARSLVRGWAAFTSRSTTLVRPPASRMAVWFSGCTDRFARAPSALATMFAPCSPPWILPPGLGSRPRSLCTPPA
mmetsp:Transcript_55044/g.141711  ORF Transcript_55044/g.141711 Transcript_55044/m.141711 type:complete len:581 (+) Transcript_55044:242-1984(+)